MVNYDWAIKALFQNGNFVSYILGRKVKTKQICELKYQAIERVLKSPFLSKPIIDPVILKQLQIYYNDGIYGENAKIQYDPQYATQT